MDGGGIDVLYKLKECENDNDYTFLLRHLCNIGFVTSGPFKEKSKDGDHAFEWKHCNMQRCKHMPPSAGDMYA